MRNSHRSSQTSSQLQSFCVLDSQRTAVKTSKLAPPKNLFMIFTNIIIRSDITLYTEDVGIDVIIISIAQQRKPKSSPVRNSHRSTDLHRRHHNYWPSQNISFLSKCRFTISHEHNNSFHPNFIYKLQT